MRYKDQLAETHHEQQQHQKEHVIIRRHVLIGHILYLYLGFMIGIEALIFFLPVASWWLAILPLPIIMASTAYLLCRRSRVIQFLLAVISLPLVPVQFVRAGQQSLIPSLLVGGSLSLFLASAIFGMLEVHGAYAVRRDTIAWNIERVVARLNKDRAAYAQRTTRNQRYRNKSGSGDFTESQWMDLCHLHRYACLACKRTEPEIMLTPDHVVPLSRGGTNEIDNIQPLCLSCNIRKHAKYIDYREVT